MRSVAAYVTAGILAVLAMDMAAPAGVFGARVRAWPALEKGVAVQTVDRTKKGDRLRAPTADSKQPVPKKAPTGVVGCDPAVSPLSAGARTDFPGRCLT